MKRFFVSLTVLAALTLVAVLPGAARCADLFAYSYDSSIIQPAGPRPLPGGSDFFNIEGRTNGDFTSFAVADFYADLEGRQIQDIAGFYVLLSQDNAAFTRDGRIKFWITPDFRDSHDASLRFDTTVQSGLSDQFFQILELGEADFVRVESGYLDVFAFQLSDEAKQHLIQYLNKYGVFRVLVSPADEDVAATYAGSTSMRQLLPIVYLDVQY